MAKKVVTKRTSVKGAKSVKGATTGGRKADFASATKSLSKSWNKAREREPQRGSGNFGPNENLPTGTYLAQLVSANCGTFKDGTPFFGTTYAIHAGKESGTEYEGEQVRNTARITEEPLGNSDRTQLDIVSDQLKLLGVDLGARDLDELPVICQELTKEQPYCILGVKNTHQLSKKTKKMTLYQNANVYEFVDEDDFSSKLAEMTE